MTRSRTSSTRLGILAKQLTVVANQSRQTSASSAYQHASTTSRSSVVQALDEHGYCVVHEFVSPSKLNAMRADLLVALRSTPTGRNKFEGSQTRRVYAVFAKTREFDDMVTDPLVLGVTADILGSDHFNLSSPVGIQIGPGERAQLLHRDDGKYPIPRPHQEVVINMIFALDDFTEQNGATLLVPRSHLARTDGWTGAEDGTSGDLIEEAAMKERRGQAAVLKGKWTASDSSKIANVPQEKTVGQSGQGPVPIQAVMPAGSVMFYRGSLLHGGGANTTDKPRLGVIMEFCAGWLRPQENHVLAVPRSIARTLPYRLQELLGYNVVPPFVGYVDGRHPRKSLEVHDP